MSSRLGRERRNVWCWAAAHEKLRPAHDAKLRAELARASRELAHETSDLGVAVNSGAAVNSLNEMIKQN
jgi:hypothetical protein